MVLFCAEWQKSPYWNIVLLALAWALTLSTSTLLTTVGPLSAKELGQSNSLAAFTIGIFMVGAAVSSVPSGWLFRTYGRFWGFTLGCVFQLLGSLLGTLALLSNEAGWLYMGCFSIGLAQGLGQFYRFSAVEITPAHLKSRAVTYVLSGGIIAAFLGPTAANYSIRIFSTEYIGSYMCVAGFAFLNQLVLQLVNFPSVQENKDILSMQSNSQISEAAASAQAGEEEGVVEQRSSVQIRSAYEICSQYMFILSCSIATLAHTIMVMVMSNVSLDMQNHGYSFGATSLVMELHFFAMFSPGFMTGRLIETYGSLMVAFVGGFLFAGSSVLLAIGDALWNYIVGMIFLGVAWNLSFSAGTVMLTSCYEPREATEVQAINDFVLFSLAGSGSLLSGFIFAELGWLVLIYVVSVLMVVYLLMFVSAWGGKGVDDGMTEPLLGSGSKHSQEGDRISTATVDTYRVTKGEENSVRGVSFTNRADGRTGSFFNRLDGRQESMDDMTLVRSMSVT